MLRKECGKLEGRGGFLMGQLLASIWTLGKSWWRNSSPWRATGAAGTMPWSAGGDSQVTAWGTQATGSGLCHNMSQALSSAWFTPLVQSSGQDAVFISRQVLCEGDNLLHTRLKRKNNEKGKPAKKSPLRTSRLPSSWLLVDSSSKGKVCFDYQHDPCMCSLIQLQRCEYLRRCPPT